ncbi:MAG: hypothetical protein ACR2QB_08920 [Gammaproteobacteria bacterium]
MPISRRQLLISLPAMATVMPPLASAAQDTVSAASPYAMPPPETEGITTEIAMGDATIELFIEGRPFDLSTGQLTRWVQKSAAIVTDYYGAFPIPEVRVNLRGARGTGVVTGQAIPTSTMARVNVLVGLKATPQALTRDWILIHELIHLAFPSIHRRHQWLTEGLSTYVESIARAQAGALTADQVWLGFLEGMPKGLPRDGDKGLDFTPTWGRTYWGGALFCLMADVQIRAETENEKSLQDGLRAICQAGYHMMEVGRVSEVLAIADQATATRVLTTQYEQMRDQPLPTEVDSLWRRLGVARRGKQVQYNDDAPQAEIRRALTERAS